MRNIQEMFPNNLNCVTHNFFTEDDCKQALDQFKSVEHTKSMMREKYQYFSVGNSFIEHLDFVTGRNIENRTPENIKHASERYLNGNKLFLPIHDLLLIKLQDLFETKVCYTDKFSPPGFSCSKPIEGTVIQPPNVWHYDDEKNYYPYNAIFSDYTDLSYFDDLFTMTLMLTHGDFTYDYHQETYQKWPRQTEICKSHFRIRGDDCGDPNCKLGQFQTIQYKAGTINVGRQCRLHRIGKSTFIHEPRIAMQMHAFMKDEVIYIYW